MAFPPRSCRSPTTFRAVSLTPNGRRGPARGRDRRPPQTNTERTMMNELRERMRADMDLAGLSPATQARYVAAVERFLRHTWVSPDAADERLLADYLRQLIGEGAARGTFKTARFGLQFLFQNTLGRDWPLLKKSCAPRGRSVFRTPTATRNAAG